MIGNFVSASHGTKPYCESLANQLGSRGFEVTTASSCSSPLLRLLQMLRSVAHENYDICHIDVFSGRAFLWAELTAHLARLRTKPIVLTLHGGGLEEFARRKSNRVRRLLASAEIVVTPAVFLRDGLGRLRKDIRVIPNGVDVSKFVWRRRSVASASLIWVRAFHNMYQPWVAVEVLAEIIQEYPRARLTFVGPDKRDGSLARTKARVKEFALGAAVSFTGALPHTSIPALLDQHDVFINTTAIESFGVSVAEAAASGLCIVTTDAGELRNIWKHEHDALIVPSGDSRAMTRAVRRVIDNPTTAQTLSENGRRRAELLSWDRILPQWEAVFEEVAGNA